ncbi:hypothetical protein EEL30_07725 [Brevibacillus laterosporus]|uniref:TsaA-like domain-containing protein n=1 Tax=Brevibacillus laterosporus TaxID=1465 RepID=A0A518V5I3_BRELA|nr:hypothetical protein EEL30_07725 [Brevibacillus laterosporus]
MSQINIIPIGQVTSSVTDKVYEGWGEMISYIDANDKTFVLDIKPYISEFDSRENVRIPLWMNELMKNYF